WSTVGLRHARRAGLHDPLGALAPSSRARTLAVVEALLAFGQRTSYPPEAAVRPVPGRVVRVRADLVAQEGAAAGQNTTMHLPASRSRRSSRQPTAWSRPTVRVTIRLMSRRPAAMSRITLPKAPWPE